MLPFARGLIILGAVLILVGVFIYIFNRFESPFGRLPGDFHVEIGNTTCMIPLVSSIVLSILLTIGLNLLLRFLRR